MKKSTTQNTKIMEETKMKNLNNQPAETTNTFTREENEMKTFIDVFNYYLDETRKKLGLTEEEFEQMLEQQEQDFLEESDIDDCSEYIKIFDAFMAENPEGDYAEFLKLEYDATDKAVAIPEVFTLFRTLEGYKMKLDFDGGIENSKEDEDQPLPRRAVINFENALMMEETLFLFEKNYKDFNKKLHLCGKDCESQYCHSCGINHAFSLIPKVSKENLYSADCECSTCKNRDCINCDHFNSILK